MIKSKVKSPTKRAGRQKSKVFGLIETSARNERGQSLVEALAALTIAVIVIVALIGLGIASMRSANLAKNNAAAAKVANLEMEVAVSLADEDWDAFPKLGTYHVTYSGGAWGQASTSTKSDVFNSPGSDIFTRQFVVNEINANEREIIVTVTFTTSSGDHNTILRTYVTNWH